MVKSKKSNLPKISVVIPSFNKGVYIQKTIQSIVDQQYPNYEINVKDGGSTDKTADILKDFKKKYPANFSFVSKKDGGQVEAINSGLREVSGDIVTFINADDIFDKGAFLAVAQEYQKNDQALWFTGFGNIIDGDGKVTNGFVTQYKNWLIKQNKFAYLLMVNYLTQPATFINSRAYQKYGPFTGTKKYVMEYALWLKLAKVSMPVVIKKNLASFRLTPDNISSNSFKELLKIDNQIAEQFTKNPILLTLHYMHNLMRTGIIILGK